MNPDSRLLEPLASNLRSILRQGAMNTIARRLNSYIRSANECEKLARQAEDAGNANEAITQIEWANYWHNLAYRERTEWYKWFRTIAPD